MATVLLAIAVIIVCASNFNTYLTVEELKRQQRRQQQQLEQLLITNTQLDNAKSTTSRE